MGDLNKYRLYGTRNIVQNSSNVETILDLSKEGRIMIVNKEHKSNQVF